MRQARCIRMCVGTGVLTLLAAVPLRAQFEGTMTFVTHTDEADGDGSLTEIAKGGKIRYDFTGAGNAGGGSMIFDSATKTRTMLLPSQKMYIKLSGDPPARSAATKHDVAWTKTGRTETVAGVKCEVYHGTGMQNGRPEEGEVCVADGVGLGINNSRLSSEMQHYSALKLAPGQGIVKASTMANGKMQVDLELTKVTKGGVTDADFAIPAGYTEMKAGGMQHGTPPAAAPRN